MHVKKYIFYIVIIIFLVSCDQFNSKLSQYGITSTKITHPTSENYISEGYINSIINEELIDSSNAISTDSSSLQIGVNEGDENYMFGNIHSVSVIDNNALMIFDDQKVSVKAFNLNNGQFIKSFLFAGGGPGEIMHPAGMATYGNTVILADRMNKLEVFEDTGNLNFESQTVLLDFTPKDICVINDRLYISGVHMNNFKTVHSYEIDSFTRDVQFHDAYKSETPSVRYLLSDISIACNNASETLIVVSQHLPYIYGYDKMGELKWVSEIDNFTPREVFQTVDELGRPRISRSIRSDGTTDIYSNLISSKSDRKVFLQMHRLVRSPGRENKGEVLTFEINSSTGEGALISEDLSFIRYIDNDFLMIRERLSFPRLKILNMN